MSRVFDGIRWIGSELRRELWEDGRDISFDDIEEAKPLNMMFQVGDKSYQQNLCGKWNEVNQNNNGNNKKKIKRIR